jgi:hypothetical protein
MWSVVFWNIRGHILNVMTLTYYRNVIQLSESDDESIIQNNFILFVIKMIT